MFMCNCWCSSYIKMTHIHHHLHRDWSKKTTTTKTSKSPLRTNKNADISLLPLLSPLRCGNHHHRHHYYHWQCGRKLCENTQLLHNITMDENKSQRQTIELAFVIVRCQKMIREIYIYLSIYLCVVVLAYGMNRLVRQIILRETVRDTCNEIERTGIEFKFCWWMNDIK